MDRTIVFPSEQPTDTLWLTAERNKMIALGYLSQGVLGTGTVADGLGCIPTVPASLAVQILPGQIYQQEPVDSVAYESLGVDTVDQIIKQGIILATTNLTLTPPGTGGQAINYLIEAELLEQDIDNTVLSYFNSANPSVPFTGPGGSGTSQPTVRQCTVSLVAKSGVAATAGSQVTPAPDVGFVGLWAVTVANGASTLTSSQIAQYPSAPFISVKLPQVPGWVQGGTWDWSVDTGTANQIIVTLVPTPTVINAGFEIKLQKIATPSNAAMTVIVNGAAPVAVVNADGSALTSTTPMGAGYLTRLIFQGTSWRWTNAPTSTAVGSVMASSGEGITVTGGGVVSLNYPGLSVEPAVAGTDLWSFYSQADTHHRVISFAQLLALVTPVIPTQVPWSLFYDSGFLSSPTASIILTVPVTASFLRITCIVPGQSTTQNGIGLRVSLDGSTYLGAPTSYVYEEFGPTGGATAYANSFGVGPLVDNNINKRGWRVEVLDLGGPSQQCSVSGHVWNFTSDPGVTARIAFAQDWQYCTTNGGVKKLQFLAAGWGNTVTGLNIVAGSRIIIEALY